MEEPFRINKRRKVFRKRLDEDEDMPDARISPALSANPPSNMEEPTILASDLNLVRRRPIVKKHGIAFTAGGTQSLDRNDEQAMILVPQSLDELRAANDRFVKPTGRVGVVEDKHLTAYVDSKLAQMRFAKSQSMARAPETTLESAALAAEAPILEDEPMDGVDDSEVDEQGLSSIQTSGKPHEYGKIQAIPRSSKSTRRRRRLPQAPDPTVAERATMVDQIMQESFVPRYAKKSTKMIRGRATTTDAATSNTDAHKLQAAGSGDTQGENAEVLVDNDEAVAEAFKAEFLRGLRERNSRKRERQILNATSTRAAPPKEGITPKLGGSRAQRGKMRAAREEAAAAKTGPTAGGGPGVGAGGGS